MAVGFSLFDLWGNLSESTGCEDVEGPGSDEGLEILSSSCCGSLRLFPPVDPVFSTFWALPLRLLSNQ